ASFLLPRFAAWPGAPSAATTPAPTTPRARPNEQTSIGRVTFSSSMVSSLTFRHRAVTDSCSRSLAVAGHVVLVLGIVRHEFEGPGLDSYGLRVLLVEVKGFGERIDVFRLLPPAQLDGAPGVIERLLGVPEVGVFGGRVEPRQVVVGRGHVRVEPQG